MGKGAQNCQQAPMHEWSHKERHVKYGRAQHQQDNQFSFIDDYIKRVVRIHELDQWFEAAFGYWPANLKEPLMVDIRK
uniref:Uncharacterized protein n=1 Tax=Romanomermis culicivorax TaxID=13658 RepID=A0A915IGL1_ROMCU